MTPTAPAYLVEPAHIGPTWTRNPDGSWSLPELTLGWQILGWTAEHLQHPDGKSWEYTDEPVRFVLWWYAVDEAGRFVYRDGVLQRMKGWGKDPMASTLSAVEFVGPCRFSHWRDNEPVAKANPHGWVQVAAVSKDQTRNTMTLFPSLFKPSTLDKYSIQMGKEIIYAHNGAQRIEAVTSSPRALEGGRPTFTIKNETHHWLRNNEGHDMAAVIDRNATKSADGASRSLSITNAYEPSEDSVAQMEREAWEAMQAGRSAGTGLLYDSLEAPPDAKLTADQAPAVIAAVRGDSVWLDVERIVQAILDPRNPPSRSRRFWYNQVVAAEDASFDPRDIDRAAVEGLELDPADEVALFFDGGKSDDSTALMACRLSDGHLFTLGAWVKPSGSAAVGWQVNRYEVDQRVREVFDLFSPVVFFADPSHAKDDDATAFWHSFIDGWHRDLGERLRVWSVQAGPNRHSILWDMSGPNRTEMFTRAVEMFTAEIQSDPSGVTHDGNPLLRQHLRNCRRAPNRYGVSVMKEHRESDRKIDLAVAAIGARMVRRLVLNRGDEKKDPTKRPGSYWGT